MSDSTEQVAATFVDLADVRSASDVEDFECRNPVSARAPKVTSVVNVTLCSDPVRSGFGSIAEWVWNDDVLRTVEVRLRHDGR